MLLRIFKAAACVLVAVLFISPDAVAQNDTTRAAQLLKKGRDLQKQAEYDSANVLLEQSANLYKASGFPLNAARCYNDISSNYRQLEEFDLARDYAHKVLTLAELHEKNFAEERTWAYFNLGMSQTVLANYDTALKQLNRAFGIADSMKVPPDTKASVLGGIGFVYDDQGLYDKAIDHYARALRLLQTSGKENKEQLAKLYNNIGVAYSNKGEYDTALQFYKQEVKLNRELKGDNHPDVAGGYNNLGAIYYRKGDIGEAVSYFERSLRIIEKAFGTLHPMAGMAHNNIGESYLEMNNYQNALDHLKKALEIKKQSRGDEHPDVALSYAGIADIYAEMGKFERAIENYRKSLAIRKNNLGEGHPTVANTLIKMGDYFLKTEQYDEAVVHLQEGIEITEKYRGKDHPYIADAYLAMGKAEAGSGRYGQSLEHLQEALVILTEQFESRRIDENPKPGDTRYPSRLAEVLYEKANVLQQSTDRDETGRLNLSLSTYKITSDLLDKLQVEYRSEQSKLLVSQLSHEVHEKAIQVCYTLYEKSSDSQYKQVAFFFSEKSKSRVILEQIQESKAKKFAGIPDSLLQHEESLRNNIASVQQQLTASSADINSSDEDLAQLEDSLFALDQRLVKLLSAFEQRFPTYYNLKYSTRSADPVQIQQFLKGTDKTALEYFLGDSTLFAFTLSADRFDIHRIPFDSTMINDIGTLRNSILQSDRTVYTKTASSLYEKLIAPILDSSVPEQLIIIPDGPLNLLPFEALLTRSPETPPDDSYRNLNYFLLATEISYSPSLTLMQTTRPERRPPESRNLIAFAPTFDSDEASGRTRSGDTGLLTEDYTLNPLPFSEYEVREIAALFEDQSGFLFSSNKLNADLYLDEQADEESFKTAPLRQYRYIHLATHAFISEGNPNRTGIAFANRENTGENGFLLMEEIYNLNLNADLVALSACETGRGTYIKGEGIIGIARAFKYAGAQNLLVSLWKIEDRSTAQLMINFYNHLLDQNSYAVSLQRAKRAMLDHPKYSDPRYWAPFILIGS